MAIYEDGTMDVLCNGKVERREYMIEISVDSKRAPLIGQPPGPPRAVPVLNEGEDIMYFINSNLPHVVKVNWPNQGNGILSSTNQTEDDNEQD